MKNSLVKYCQIAGVSVLVALSTQISAKTIWSDYSVTYLKGNNYEVGDESRQVLTFEYASGTSWGDHFMFFDRLESDNGDVETYGEFTPRIKLTDFDNAFVKSVYFAPSIEFGPETNYLIGLGSDLKMPGFNYFQLNAYVRNNGDGDSSFQTTLVWALPVGPFIYDGFLDYATGVDNTMFGDTEAQVNFTSQLKYDIAPVLSLDTKLFVGIEYVFWVNKFGIDGVDEKNANFLIRYHF